MNVGVPRQTRKQDHVLQHPRKTALQSQQPSATIKNIQICLPQQTIETSLRQYPIPSLTLLCLCLLAGHLPGAAMPGTRCVAVSGPSCELAVEIFAVFESLAHALCVQARRDYEQNFFPREPIHVVCGQVVSAHPVVLRNVEASRLVVGGERARLAAKAVGLSPTAVPFSPNKNAESRTFTWQSPEYTVGNVVHVRVAHHSAAHYGKKVRCGQPLP